MKNKKAAVRNLMHGKRKMCSVCEIARELGLDTEVVKPLMVEIAMDSVRHEPTRRRKPFTDEQIETMKQLWNNGQNASEIARAIRRNYNSVRHKLRMIRQEGILQERWDA